MPKVKRKNIRRKRTSSSTETKDFAFIDCPVAGATFSKTRKGNSLHMFDRIGFFATDITKKSFEVEGLSFDKDKGWYDANVDIPKYYGKGVYDACMEYAVDKAISDNLFLKLAIFGKKRPALSVLMLSRSEIAKRLENRGCVVCRR